MASILTSWQEKDFNEFVAAKGSGLVEFVAPWCGACKMMEPMVAEIATNNADKTIVKIDVSQNQTLASKMGVMSLPNLLVIKEGKVVDQLIGSSTKKAIEDKLQKI